MPRLDLEITKGSSFSHTFTTYSEDYLNLRGEWSSLTEYEVDDVVTYKKNVYKCILDSSNGEKPTNVTYFGTPELYDYSVCTFASKIRTDHDEEASIIDFTHAFPAAGQYKILLSAVQTAALDFKTAVYDTEITKGTEVWKETYGNITLRDEATK